MSRTILVPIDISEMQLTTQVIPNVQEYAGRDITMVHFLAVIPDHTYFAAYGLEYAAIAPERRMRSTPI